MVALNFVLEFADDVETGIKTQTIRQSARCKPGDKLQLYTGQRTKACRKLGEGICEQVVAIELAESEAYLEGWKLNQEERDDLARADGFVHYDAMWNWFHKRYETENFKGFVIRWEHRAAGKEGES